MPDVNLRIDIVQRILILFNSCSLSHSHPPLLLLLNALYPTWMISCFTWRSGSGLECQLLAEPQNRSLAGRIGRLGQRKGVRIIRCHDCNCSSLVGIGQWVWPQVQSRRKDVSCKRMGLGNNLCLRSLRFWMRCLRILLRLILWKL